MAFDHPVADQWSWRSPSSDKTTGLRWLSNDVKMVATKKDEAKAVSEGLVQLQLVHEPWTAEMEKRIAVKQQEEAEQRATWEAEWEARERARQEQREDLLREFRPPAHHRDLWVQFVEERYGEVEARKPLELGHRRATRWDVEHQGVFGWYDAANFA